MQEQREGHRVAIRIHWMPLVRISVAVLVAVLVFAVIPVTVLAIDDPDAALAVNGVFVYNDLLEEGDAGILIDYFIDYSISGNPTETATESYLGIFIDTDGTTQLKAVAPYTFQDSGYGRGIIWIYFTAAEVTTYSIDSTNEALYRVWLVGNPTLSWVPGPDPPKTIAGIDSWLSTAALFPSTILGFADLLELAWTIDLIQETPLGSRLTVQGESYFMNAIPNLRLMAPAIFASGTTGPSLEDLDYSTAFGATVTDLTGSIVGSPVTLVSGSNTLTGTGNGTLTIELTKGTVGTATSGAGGTVVTNSPVDLVFGTNTITITLAGTNEFDVDVELVNTQTGITDTITGTGLDLSDAAAAFGMSRVMFSGLIWLIVSILICAAFIKVASTKGILLIFDVCIIGGAVLGLVPILVAALLFIGFGTITGYVLFFRGAGI
ncbi:hypothetical protein LCGC14_0539860 [marine sediment metagenome]|uniref:Uncharacterized protein n=1 Tax=marine sediment metagenome TaxID=412755 RepID=A0A0F9RXT7_9ZZZZ